jgi:hypothetical protein
LIGIYQEQDESEDEGRRSSSSILRNVARDNQRVRVLVHAAVDPSGDLVYQERLYLTDESTATDVR